MEVYEPSEDSYFFASFLKKYFSELNLKEISYLDLGTGSGILAKTALESGISKSQITVSDINSQALKILAGQDFKTVKSNLFENLKKSKFDLITFNAPYLPEEKKENKSTATITSGGKKGDEISLEFLKQAKKQLNNGGKILLLISSLTPIKKISKFKPRIVAEKSLFFEKLLILEFSK